MRHAKILGGLLWAGAALCGCGDDGTPPADGGPEASTSAVDGGLCACDASACDETVEITSAQHLPGLVIDSDPPPAGGNHAPCWADYRVYSEELPAANWVHNLEHGAVVLLHHCPDGCDDDLAALAAFTQDHPRTLLTPYTPMSARFAAISWGHRLSMDCLDVPAIQAFYDAHFDKGRESVASGKPASCP